MKKYLRTSIAIALLVCLNVIPVNAAEQNYVNNNESYEISEVDKEYYENTILNMNLSPEDESWLIHNSSFEQEMISLKREGWVLKNVSVEDVDTTKNSFARSTTVEVSGGKVVSSDYVQPTKSKKVYNNTIYSNAQSVKNAVSMASNFVSFKYSWVASTLFSIDTSKYAVFFNNGYQTLEENSTLHIKDVYYKEGIFYWIGYSVSKINIAGVISYYYKDNNKDPHMGSKSYSCSFSSPSYNKSNADLVALAKKYSNTGWVDEDISYSPAIIYIR